MNKLASFNVSYVNTTEFFKIMFGPPYTAQKISLYVAIITLIIFMVLIGVAFSTLNNNIIFPPNISSCPDFFEMTEDKKCVNVNSLGNPKCADRTFDFQTPEYLGPDGIRYKHKKAKECGWQWDGITNNSRFLEV